MCLSKKIKGIKILIKYTYLFYQYIILLFNYKNIPDYLKIDTLLACFDETNRQFIKNFILSRSTIKNKIMVEAYRGTIWGYKEKFKNNLMDIYGRKSLSNEE